MALKEQGNCQEVVLLIGNSALVAVYTILTSFKVDWLNFCAAKISSLKCIE